jgi:hypothetical protein
MANYSAIKAAVNAYIKANGRKEITGNILNAVLRATIDSLGRYFQFAGGALPTDDPGTPDQNVCYLAGEPGMYTNFGGITIENEEVALLFWDGEWTKQRILIGIREVNASVDNQVGTPSVDVSYSGGQLVLTFHNLKGDQGETGDPAGFGTIGADITGGVGTPGVSVESSGDNTSKNLMFHFTNLKGETGVTSVVATIDNTSGTPSCQVSLVNGVLTLAFSGLKGLKGDTGVSADYPITIYNGLDSDATDQALAAAQGKFLQGEISQLQDKVTDLENAVMETSSGYEELALTLRTGYYYYSNGDYYSGSDKRCADIDVQEGEKYKITSHLRATTIALIVEWDGNGNYVGYVKRGTGADENVVDYEYTVPAGVAKIGISNGDYGYAIGLHAKKLVTQSVSKVYTKDETNALLDGYYTKDEIDEKETITTTETEELAPTSATQGYVAIPQTIGQIVSFDTRAGFGNILSFPIIPGGSVVTINFSSSTGHYGFALCDENDIVLEYCDNYGLESYTFGEHAGNTRLYASSNKFTSASIERVVTESVKDAVIQLKQEVNPQSERWEGKTILWFGTSIPAGSDSTIPGAGETIAGNYPTEVGNDLKAIVINKAVGGSMCRANVRTGDYVGANFANITSALTMTKAEIESFITNYATIKDVLTGGAPSTLSADQITRLSSASFEDRLIPYLDGTYPMPDLFVIDHGHNDFKYTLPGGGSDIGLLPIVANIGGDLAEDTYMTANNNEKLESFFGSLANIPAARKAEFVASVNRNCYIGAVNFIVTLILHYNPHARILFISNYEYENGAYPTYAPLIPAQETLAKSWAFPLCEVYKYLGFSNHLIPGSMAWFNTTYPNVTPATTDVTAYRAYLPDNVHPHSDTTGDSNNNYAGIISEFIKKIY